MSDASEFSLIPLGDLFERVSGGGTPPRNIPEYWGGGIPWASVKDFKDGVQKLTKTEESITEIGLKNSTSKLIDAGIPVVCVRMAVGRSAITQMPVAINQDVKALVPKKTIDSKYICYLLDYFRDEIDGRAIGSTVKGIATGDLLKIKVPFPASEKQQQKIAHILTTVDNLIEKTQTLIDKYTAVKQGMMHDLFTRGIDIATGQLRPSYEQAPELYKETELGWVPREWGVVTLGSLATRITNGFVGVATPFYSTNESGVRYLYGNNVRKNRLELHNVLYVTKEFHEKQKKSQLQAGDMLTVQSGHIGTTAVVPADAGEMNCHALIITKFKPGMSNPDFISAYCNSEIGMQRMESIFIGSTILHINTSDLKEFKVLLPALDEQNAIYGRLSAINAKLNTESGLLEKAKLQKKGLMQDLLTGRVRVDCS